jgi:hypothetical protein
MTVSKVSATCWTIFIVMCVGFMPLCLLAANLHALPVAGRIVLMVLVVGGLWWGPFCYAMYLAMAVMRNGDRRLLKRGIAGTAEVLSAKATNTVIQEGEFAWEAPRVYKYRLRVSVPGKQQYETTCSICAAGIREGQTVNVAVSKHNSKRVTIDVGQSRAKGSARDAQSAGPVGVRVGASVHNAGSSGLTSALLAQNASFEAHQYVAGSGSIRTGSIRDGASGFSADTKRLNALSRLGQLHAQGVLTDDEFDAEKTRILAE